MESEVTESTATGGIESPRTGSFSESTAVTKGKSSRHKKLNKLEEMESLLRTDSSEGNERLCEQGPETPDKVTDSRSSVEMLKRGSSGSASSPHAYHIKRKFNFRSDSVFSDVMPMSSTTAAQCQEITNKASETPERGGSLTSLKVRESKWVSLRKKLTRINSISKKPSSSTSSTRDELGDLKEVSGKEGKVKRIEEKRSLLQRAKTLSILPVGRASKGTSEEKVEVPKRVKEEPPELFNVGGEMNLIPLELLIDINDLKLK